MELAIFVLSSSGAVWSFLRGGMSFLGTAYIGPIGGSLFSLIFLDFCVKVKKQYKENPYVPHVCVCLSIAAILIAIFFATSAVFLLFYDRSYFGKKIEGPTDDITIAKKEVYKVKTDPKGKSSVHLLFFTEDEAVKKLDVMPSYTRPLGDKKNTVDRLWVRTTKVELKRTGFMFLDVEDVNGCNIMLSVELKENQQRVVKVAILYTYYQLTKWQEFLRWLLERYYA